MFKVLVAALVLCGVAFANTFTPTEFPCSYHLKMKVTGAGDFDVKVITDGLSLAYMTGTIDDGKDNYTVVFRRDFVGKPLFPTTPAIRAETSSGSSGDASGSVPGSSGGASSEKSSESSGETVKGITIYRTVVGDKEVCKEYYGEKNEYYDALSAAVEIIWAVEFDYTSKEGTVCPDPTIKGCSKICAGEVCVIIDDKGRYVDFGGIIMNWYEEPALSDFATVRCNEEALAAPTVNPCQQASASIAQVALLVFVLALFAALL